MDADRLERYFRGRLPEREGLELIKHWRIVGGMSRETWFADLRWCDAGQERTERVTVRVDHPEGAVVPVPLRFEYDVLTALAKTDVPAALPFWFEDDPELIGVAPFYVRETVAGSASPKHLYAEGQEGLRRSIGYQFAELLGKVHTVDWEQVGCSAFMEVPEDAEQCALLELSRYRRNFEANRTESLPVAAELFAWLERNAPKEVARVSLVWGDVGIGNFIFDGGRIVALTDWEQAHLGDPMKDWASALWRAVDNLLPREEMFARYEEVSGIPINDESIHYYTAFIDAQYTCTSNPVIHRFAVGDNPDITFARLGLGIPWYCLDHGYRTIGS